MQSSFRELCQLWNLVWHIQHLKYAFKLIFKSNRLQVLWLVDATEINFTLPLICKSVHISACVSFITFILTWWLGVWCVRPADHQQRSYNFPESGISVSSLIFIPFRLNFIKRHIYTLCIMHMPLVFSSRSLSYYYSSYTRTIYMRRGIPGQLMRATRVDTWMTCAALVYYWFA